MNLDRRFSVLVAAVLLCACMQQPAPPMPRRIVDLSPTIREDLPVRTVGRKFLADFLTAEQNRDIFYNNAARFLRLDQKAKP